jgi:hypothetical protein
MALVIAGAATACQLDVEYGHSSYACQADTDCPDPQTCSVGFCTSTPAPIPDGDAADAPSAPGDGGGAGGDDDAAAPDAGAPDADGDPDLLADPGFEAGLDGWEGYLGTASSTDVARTGAHALRVCKDDGHKSFVSVYRDVIVGAPEQVPAGARFHAEVWVRAAPGQLAPTALTPSVRERGGASAFVDHAGPTLTSVDDEWRLLVAEGTIGAADRSALAFVIEAGNGEADGTCFLLDDARVVRLDE